MSDQDRIAKLESELASVRNSKPQPTQVVITRERSEFSIGWFIFWLIIFWPIALVYAAVKIVTK